VKRTVTLAGIATALAVTGAVVYAQGRAVIFADSRTASFKAMMPGVSTALLWGTRSKGHLPGSPSLLRLRRGNALPLERRVTRRHDGATCTGTMPERSGWCGRFLADPGGHKHWSGGDAKEGALFYQETFGKFDLIPAK